VAPLDDAESLGRIGFFLVVLLRGDATVDVAEGPGVGLGVRLIGLVVEGVLIVMAGLADRPALTVALFGGHTGVAGESGLQHGVEVLVLLGEDLDVFQELVVLRVQPFQHVEFLIKRLFRVRRRPLQWVLPALKAPLTCLPSRSHASITSITFIGLVISPIYFIANPPISLPEKE
jgi:hypothetical protein